MLFDSDLEDHLLFRPRSFNIKVQSQLLGKLIKARNCVAKRETHPLPYAQKGLTALKHKNNPAKVQGKNHGC